MEWEYRSEKWRGADNKGEMGRGEKDRRGYGGVGGWRWLKKLRQSGGMEVAEKIATNRVTKVGGAIAENEAVEFAEAIAINQVRVTSRSNQK